MSNSAARRNEAHAGGANRGHRNHVPHAYDLIATGLACERALATRT